MNNFIEPGEVLDFVAPGGGVVSGTPVLIQNTLVIPQVSAAAGASFAGVICGVFTLAKTAGSAWSTGQVLYWDSATSSFTTAFSATARRMGFAAAPALSADTSGRVKLLNIAAAVNVAQSSMFDELVAQMDRAVQSALGAVTVTYTPPVGAAVPVAGMFDENYVLAKGDAEAGTETIGPAVFFRRSDLPADPYDDDDDVTRLAINGITYRITERRPDGQGGIVLALRRLT